METDNYSEIANKTREHLQRQGWCFWKCSNLNNEIITIIRNEPKLSETEEQTLMAQICTLSEKHPEYFPDKEHIRICYTEKELAILAKSQNSITILHAMKKQGATLESTQSPTLL